MVKKVVARAASERQVIVEMRAALPTLRPAERRVVELFLKAPARLAEASIGEVAIEGQTSQATVSRLARSLGYSGYPDFRLAVARAATIESVGAENHGAPPGDISPDDSLADVVAKIAYNESRAVEETARAIDLKQLREAVDAVVGARRIDIYGIGASGFVAEDLHQKLHRIGLNVFVWREAHSAITSAANLGPKDVTIGVSHSGATFDITDAVRLGSERGARAIAITNFGKSPLATMADIVLLTAARETTLRSGATSSRIAQLAVIDFLFVGVASRSFQNSVEAIERTRMAVSRRRAR
jgi:DNA-binding MurR/RpiR family transcriptional regulator